MNVFRFLVDAVFAPSVPTVRIGPAAGLRFDPGPSNPDYASGNNELPVQEALKAHLKTDDVVFDVGANVGFLSVVAATLVGPAGTVYAFEPVPANARLVQRNADLNRLHQIRLVVTAVGDRDGTADLVLAKYSGGAALATAEPPPDAVGCMQVKVATIDQLVNSGGFKPPTFVKIDVEGAELDVLRGMELTAKEFRPTILYELDSATSEGIERKRIECEAWLRDRGYRVHELKESYEGISWVVKHFLAVPVESSRRC